MVDLKGKTSFEFGDFKLIPNEGLLLKGGKPVPLTLKSFEALVFLIENRGHLVLKSELMDKIWSDSFVEENAVSKTVWSIRSALDDDSKEPRFIQTVPKRGYRFVGDVCEVGSKSEEVETSGLISPSNLGAFSENSSKPRRAALGLAGIAAAVVFGLLAWTYPLWIPAGVSAREIKTLTVLPLENATGEADQYFVEGITDDIVADLSDVGEVRIIALPADLQKSEPYDPVEIAKRVAADAFVAGSVSRSGGRVRISVRLVDASTGRDLWANTYERDAREISVLHKDVARQILEGAGIKLTQGEQKRLDKARPIVPEAYDEFLRGRYYLNLQNRRDQETAIAALERAVQIDDTFAAAFAELAQAYTWKNFSFTPDQKDLSEKAFVATEKALSLDPELADAYLARGRLLWTPGNHFPHEKAIRDYRRALELDPNLDEARNQLALVYCHIGLLDEALREAREGVRIDPANNLLQLRIGQTLNSQGKFEEALSVLRSVPNEVHPSMIGHQTAWALFNLGRKAEAEEKVDQLLRDEKDAGGTFAAMKAVLAASGGRGDLADAFIAQAIEKGKGYGHFHHTAYTIACAYALMDRRDEAIKYLQIAAETGFPCYPAFETDSNLNNLREDPRFSGFLAEQKEQWQVRRSL